MSPATIEPSSLAQTRLPFGREVTCLSDSVQDFTDTVSSVIKSLRQFDALGDKNAFCHCSAPVDINGLQLIASASSAVSYVMDDADSDHVYAFLPSFGAASARINGYSQTFHAETSIALLPNIHRSGETSAVAMVQMNLDVDRLAMTAHTMLGEEAKLRVTDQLKHPQIIDYQQGNVRYDLVFRGLYRIIDELRLDEQRISAMRLDDSFYRTVVMMLNPQACLAGGVGISVRAQSAKVGSACEYMRAHYRKAITLTELEQVSQSTARSLQLAFQKELGCSPMRWLKNLRLDEAHQRLRHPQEGDTAKAIALGCGFSRWGAFREAYLARFGEMPVVKLP